MPVRVAAMNTGTRGRFFRATAAVTAALLLVLAGGSPASALSVGEFFSIKYNVEFSRTEVYQNQTFTVTITGEATCTNEPPMTVSEAQISGKVVARHTESGAEVVLNPEYTLTINPFPNDVGQIISESQTVELRFPADSLPGSYNISGELIEARVKALLWFNVTSYLPSSQSMGVISYMPPGEEEEEEDEEDEIPQPPFDGKTYTEGSIGPHGTITAAVIAPSVDGKCRITLEAGVRALNAQGQALPYIGITEMDEPPPVPENRNTISLVYDIRPAGATFDPPAMLTVNYEESELPEGVSEENLVIATWDEAQGRWVEMEGCIVDTQANSITAPVSHFSAFAAMAGTMPASFAVSSLSVSPDEVYADDSVTVSAVVSNEGDLSGSCEVVLKVGGEVIETEAVMLAGGESRLVSFNVSGEQPGLYSVDVNGAVGSFSVIEAVDYLPPSFSVSDLSISPDEVYADDSVTVSAVVSNEGDLSGSCEVVLKVGGEVIETEAVMLAGGESRLVSFNVSGEQPGLYSVDVNGAVGSFSVIEAVDYLPPSFSVSDLSISPDEVYADDSVTVSAVVSNEGDLSGSCEVVLKVGGEVIETETVMLAGGESRLVSFNVLREKPGLYSVDVNGAVGSFSVIEAIANTTSPPQQTNVQANQAGETNRWLPGVISAGCLTLLILLLWFVWYHKKTKKDRQEEIIIHRLQPPPDED